MFEITNDTCARFNKNEAICIAYFSDAIRYSLEKSIKFRSVLRNNICLQIFI